MMFFSLKQLLCFIERRKMEEERLRAEEEARKLEEEEKLGKAEEELEEGEGGLWPLSVWH